MTDRRRRWRWWGFGAVVLLLLLAPILASRLVPRDRVRDLVVEQVSRATGGEVAFSAAEVKLGWGLGLSLVDGRLAGTGRALAAASGTNSPLETYTVDVSRADVKLALWPLVQRRFEVSSLRLRCSAARITTADAAHSATDLDLQIDDLSWGLVGAGPAVAGAAEMPPGEAIPADLVLAFHATAATLTSGGSVYHQVRAAGDLDDRVLTVSELEAKRGGGTITGEVTLDYGRDPWGELTFSVDVAAVPAVDLLVTWVPELAARLDCDLDGQASGRCRVKDRATALATLDVTGNALGATGVLHAADWLIEVTPYLGRRQDLKDIRFDELRHRFRVSEGRYLVQELALPGAETDWNGTGWVSLDGDMDLGLAVRLPPGFTPELGQWSFLASSLRDEANRVNLAFRLAGPLANPAFQVDLNALLGGGR